MHNKDKNVRIKPPQGREEKTEMGDDDTDENGMRCMKTYEWIGEKVFTGVFANSMIENLFVSILFTLNAKLNAICPF